MLGFDMGGGDQREGSWAGRKSVGERECAGPTAGWIEVVGRGSWVVLRRVCEDNLEEQPGLGEESVRERQKVRVRE